MRSLHLPLLPRDGGCNREYWRAPARVVLVGPWFRDRESIVLPVFDIARLGRHRPEVIAAPVPVLRRLARATLSDTGCVPAPDLGLVALTGVFQTPLLPADRDLLWTAFRIPVYEQFRAPDGTLLAWECEAHSGLHIETSRVVFTPCQQTGELQVGFRCGGPFRPTGFDARITDETCGCGCDQPRLVDLDVWKPAPAAAISAHA